ncbi:alpha-2-macroglobulin receptor-associated protein-like [Uloborus diversus]|uniref:alpha-2-macroglobulin receptor-associated protein-like n=1 Tax=Uloborus diversus TaxID=327109 RepID=UPI002409DEBD|nr:alpha-2-macroglobulin receptor-associated protein-like [Uloborus diversus]
MKLHHFISAFLLFVPCLCHKYSKESNALDYQKLIGLDKPFRMQKLNLVWEKAVKKISPEKLKLLYTDLKFQDKEELSFKMEKSKGLDKSGLKESLIQASFKAILEKYNLMSDFEALQGEATVFKPDENDAEMKSIFKDKKLNKLWLKAEKQGFSEEELRTLKEEFQHHQNKIDQYYGIINQLHDKNTDDNTVNKVEHVIYAEEKEKIYKTDNPHQVLKEKHADLKAGYDYLNSKIIQNYKNMEFEEPQVNSLWEMAKNASFSPEELESLRGELHHFEHKIKKFKMLSSLETEKEDSNSVDGSLKKREKKLKEYGYKVEKFHKELASRILQRHSEL